MKNQWLFAATLPVAMATLAPYECAYAVQYLTVEQAQTALFADQKSLVFKPSDLVLSKEQLKAIAQKSGVNPLRNTVKLWEVWQDKKLHGYFVVDEVYGKHEFITYAVALNPEQVILGVEILTYRETYGGEVRNVKWRAQFKDKKATDNLQIAENIKNISGATLSCKHLTEGVKRTLTTLALYGKPAV